MADPVTVAGAIIGTGASVALYSKWQRDQMKKSDVWGWLCGAKPLCGFDESEAVTIMVEFISRISVIEAVFLFHVIQTFRK